MNIVDPKIYVDETLHSIKWNMLFLRQKRLMVGEADINKNGLKLEKFLSKWVYKCEGLKLINAKTSDFAPFDMFPIFFETFSHGYNPQFLLSSVPLLDHQFGDR